MNEEYRSKQDVKDEFGEFTQQIATVLDASQSGGDGDDDSSDSVFDGGDEQ